ncbi:hypothetical protein ACFFGH_26015 [Lysobacter korlensis]|uniref:Uncharacterized protein n=1 Tax=Lysobacter korlensis TaxID=553636 RepID=A0ABV6RWE3_9GAMM
MFLVEPLSAKRGRALTWSFIELAAGFTGTSTSEELFAEAIGAANYALITGEHVQEFDEGGRYIRTWMSETLMVEPPGDIPPAAPGQRLRVIASPWEDIGLRAEEVEALCLSAFYWQSVGGLKAVDSYLEAGAGRAGTVAALQVLLGELSPPVATRLGG